MTDATRAMTSGGPGGSLHHEHAHSVGHPKESAAMLSEFSARAGDTLLVCLEERIS